jgi:transposase
VSIYGKIYVKKMITNRYVARTNDFWSSNIWLLDKSLNVLEWPSHSPDMNPIEHLWRDLKIAVQRRSPFNLTELERIYREIWEKLPKYSRGQTF